MNRVVLGALVALMLAGVGLFWLQGRAEVERGAPPPAPTVAPPTGLPSADVSSRTDSFRRLDVDGNNLLTFEEWAVATSGRFAGADADGNGELSPAEFATTAPKPKPKPRCDC